MLTEAEHLVKHLHLSHRTDHGSASTVLMKTMSSYHNETNDKSAKKSTVPEEALSISERLYMNFTETCPLFLLKEGIDHRFEFLDFAPDLYIRQTFHPINEDEFISKNADLLIDRIHSNSNTQLQRYPSPSKGHPTTEIE